MLLSLKRSLKSACMMCCQPGNSKWFKERGGIPMARMHNVRHSSRLTCISSAHVVKDVDRGVIEDQSIKTKSKLSYYATSMTIFYLISLVSTWCNLVSNLSNYTRRKEIWYVKATWQLRQFLIFCERYNKRDGAGAKLCFQILVPHQPLQNRTQCDCDLQFTHKRQKRTHVTRSYSDPDPVEQGRLSITDTYTHI